MTELHEPKRLDRIGRGRELLFLAPGDVRKARVEPISWMRTCDAFAAKGIGVTLATFRVRYPDAVHRSDLWSHFGVARRFKVWIFPTPLKRDSSPRAQRFWAGVAAFGLTLYTLAGCAARRRDLIVYARSPLLLGPFVLLRPLLPSSRRPRLVYETHALPPESAWRVVRRADLVVTNSARLERDLARLADVQADRILHAPLPPYAHVKPMPKSAARKELGLPSEGLIGCYTGKMLDDQAAFLIEVARLTYDRLPDFRMLLVGGNPDVLDRLRARVNAAGLGGQVLLPGFVDPARVSVYQSAADVLIFHMDSDLSHFEYCTPAKGFDYQATGRPIVARDIPLFDEVFGAGEERAIRVMEPTPERFAVAIAHALDLEDGGRAMTERARTWVAGRSWQGRAEAVLDSLYPRP